MDEMEFLPKMNGKKINTPTTKPSGSAPTIPERDWIILEKLSACNENQLAYMRIYKQIPLDGTRLDNQSVRQSQAHGPRKHVELEAFKGLTETGRTATPKLLGYRIGTQDADDLVPGGYIIFLVWEKVQGEPLDEEYFWSFPYNKRRLIRDNFKKAFEEVLSSGYKPVLSSSSKIILNKDTSDVKISGFSQAARIDTDTKWKDNYFVIFSLVLDDYKQDKYLPNMATDLQVDQHTGWRW
ncbi:hypothetical protein N7474_010176 [Penicillium riverlandense]|uniref:uncharacterized protein n=1 Tax=Penicillium riverlandense TaxID=1903569 RepID=UPI0025496898|nr:uncharacterized protein N7474_010176 [Penicillium riverlandense]KAJ5808907.1 hypothetical protein N7474_010176 [Penicillium riverlandense]